MTLERGEMWWLETEAGRRPVCILTRSAAIEVLTSVLVAPATRTVRGIPSEVALSKADHLPADCALSFDNVTTVPKALLSRRISRVPDARLPELCEALRVATGC